MAGFLCVAGILTCQPQPHRSHLRKGALSLSLSLWQWRRPGGLGAGSQVCNCQSVVSVARVHFLLSAVTLAEAARPQAHRVQKIREWGQCE